MNKLRFRILLVVIFLFSVVKVNAQDLDIQKYDYIEVIVVQKSNNKGKIKNIKVDKNSLKGKTITAKQIQSLSGTTELLNYMNDANWEFVDKKATNSGKKDIWISYIFRKKKQRNKKPSLFREGLLNFAFEFQIMRLQRRSFLTSRNDNQ